MEQRRLGRNGPEISVIGYGAWEAGGAMWGDEAADEVTIAAMHAAIDAGMTWIDTAEAYGDGRSEELVGEVLAVRRDEVQVFTKVAPFASGTRPEQVHSAVRGSLKRLGIDRIDLYQVHWPDEEHVPIEDTWGAMAELQDEGLVASIGLSNVDRGLIERCLPIRHVDSVQNQYSLLHRDDDELLGWLQEHGIGYLAYGPLAFGLLTGAITTETRFDDDDWRSGVQWQLGYWKELFAPGKLEPNLERVERLRPIADDLGLDLATLALRAAIEAPGVTAVIAGSRNPAHVRANAIAGTARLEPSTAQEVAAALSSR